MKFVKKFKQDAHIQAKIKCKYGWERGEKRADVLVCPLQATEQHPEHPWALGIQFCADTWDNGEDLEAIRTEPML